jgi:hypothetical protein
MRGRLRVRSLLVIAPASLVLLAGCGESTYSYRATRACLAKRQRVRLSDQVDFVASTALGGAFRARFRRNEVTISFSPSPERANAIANAYRRFHGRNIGIADVLQVRRNAVLLWALHASKQNLAAVQGCLQ